MLELPDFAAMFAEIAATREPELVLLKGHLYVERALAWVTAARLHSPDEKFDLKYIVLAKLAIRNEGDRKRVVALNELRNALAHEFGALETPRFANIIGKFDLPWPSGPLERAITLQLIVQDVYYRTINALVLELHLDSEPILEDDFDKEIIDAYEDSVRRDAKLQKVCRLLIERDDWDSLVDVFRPGWQRP